MRSQLLLNEGEEAPQQHQRSRGTPNCNLNGGCDGEGGLIVIGIVVVLLPLAIAGAGTYYVFKKEVDDIKEDPRNWRTWAKSSATGTLKALAIATSYMAVQQTLTTNYPLTCEDLEGRHDSSASSAVTESCSYLWNLLSVPVATTSVAAATAVARKVVESERVASATESVSRFFSREANNVPGTPMMGSGKQGHIQSV